MNATLHTPLADTNHVVDLITKACDRIAPSWPLDRWIAVNPWWGHRNQAIEQAASELEVLGGQSMLMPPEFYLEAWHGGRIQSQDLADAAREKDIETCTEALVHQLEHAGPRPVHPGLDLALRTTGEDGAFPDITGHLGRLCAHYFDRRQSRWSAATEGSGLYAYWLLQPEPRGLASRALKQQLPTDWQEAAEFLAQSVPYNQKQLSDVAHALMLQLPGWASWCRGEDWRAGLEGEPPQLTQQFATVLLAYEWMHVLASPPAAQVPWRFDEVASRVARSAYDAPVWLWHRAYEIAWQRRFADCLLSRPGLEAKPAEVVPEVQAAFCIDVRSEVLRRHLETCHPKAETLGVAGFFGLPVVHKKLGASGEEARLPGLLAPAFRYNETLGDPARDNTLARQRDSHAQVKGAVRQAKYGSLSTFTLVETTGLAWAWKLVRDGLQKNRPGRDSRYDGHLHHRGNGDLLSDSEKIGLAEGLLRSMSLTQGFAPLLVLVGHGAHTDNNPNQAGLACGACGGQNGDVNAAIAARLLNSKSIRAGLAERGIAIPESTLVVAAEHCTVTDQVRILNPETIPSGHQRIVSQLEERFAKAAASCRRERAAALGLNGYSDAEILAELSRRTRNWAEVRPEWGLANNAAMIIAPRRTTRVLNLSGRCFLHEYRPELDDDSGSVLSALMSAPMVVANWINLQYFGSVTQPSRYGAGNKLLHSVVGGNIGVVEGNGTDLRIGLPWQSVHDGERWRHEPLRLTVVIDAPAERIEQVLHSQKDVRALVDNQWLWLWRMHGTGLQKYVNGQWLTA